MSTTSTRAGCVLTLVARPPGHPSSGCMHSSTPSFIMPPSLTTQISPPLYHQPNLSRHVTLRRMSPHLLSHISPTTALRAAIARFSLYPPQQLSRFMCASAPSPVNASASLRAALPNELDSICYVCFQHHHNNNPTGPLLPVPPPLHTSSNLAFPYS